MQQIEKATSFLQLTELDNIKAFDLVKEKTGVKVSVIAFGLSIFTILLSLLVDVSGFVIIIVCAIIPIIFSFKSIENAKQNRDNIRYMTYWVVFALTQIAQDFLELIFNPTILMIFRVSLTIALLHPKINLSLVIFDIIVKPFLNKRPETIGEKVDSMKQKLQQTAKKQINSLTQDFKKTEEKLVDEATKKNE